MNIRIGQGFDVHAFARDRKLVLGGVAIPFHLGLAGHSDADVVIHAICDALLGAAGLGDIGQHFPDSDDRFAGADSKGLLIQVVRLLEDHGWQVGNVDVTIIAQRPRLAKYIPEMRQTLATLLGTDLSSMSIKATTTEHLGFTGREEGIAALAVCLLAAAISDRL